MVISTNNHYWLILADIIFLAKVKNIWVNSGQNSGQGNIWPDLSGQVIQITGY